MKTRLNSLVSKFGNLVQIGALAAAAWTVSQPIKTVAADIEWQGGTASYTNAADWVGGIVPGTADNAVNDNGTNNIVQINAGDPDWTVGQILAGNGAGDGAFEQNGQTLTLTGTNLNGSVVSAFNTPFHLGIGAANTGVYTLNDGDINYGSGGFNVGELGTGVLNVSGGTISGSGNFAVNLGSLSTPVAVTATVGNGLTLGDYTWFEQGLPTAQAGYGLPSPGTTITSLSQSDHSYTLPPSYAANDAVLVSTNLTAATITMTTPAASYGLSLLATAGDGPVGVNYTVHHADNTTETGTLSVPDWFGPSNGASEVLSVAARVDALGANFQYPGSDAPYVGNPPYLWSLDIALTNTTSPVTSIDLTYTSGGTATVLAMSSQTTSGGSFDPVAITGFNEDVIVEKEAQSFVSSSITDVFNQTGGAINITNGGQFFVGNYGNGVYNLSGGTMDVHNYIAFGRSGGSGTVNMTGGTLNQDGGGNLLVGTGYNAPSGASAVGILNQSGGTINCVGQFLVPESSPSTGTYNISNNAVLNVHDWLAVGRSGGDGTLNISGNAVIVRDNSNDSGANFDVGASSIGVVNQDGGAITNLAGQTWIGEASSGTWNLNDGIAYLGVLHLAQNGDASGTLNMNGGSLYVSEITQGNINGGAQIDFNGGTVYALADNSTFLHDITFVGLGGDGLTIDSQGYDLGISQELDDNGGGGLTKNGAGTLTLTGPNTYSGNTVVNGGALITTTASSATGNYTVADNAAFGVVVDAAQPQLSVSSLTVGSSTGATLDFDLGSSGLTAAPLNVGTLAAAGTIIVNVSGAVSAGTFPLITYSTGSGSTDFEVGSLPTGVAATVVDDTTDHSVNLIVTAVNQPVWSGLDGGNWDIGVTTNWVQLSDETPTTYQDGNGVLFNDSATGTTTVNLTTDVHPSSVLFTNNSLTYTLVGSGKISGSIGLNKQGSGSLAVLNTGGNDYTGPTVISGGTLSVTNLANGGSPSAVGASSADAANLVIGNGTFSYGGAPVTVNRGFTLSGSGAAIDTENNLALSGAVAVTSTGGFSKTGPAQLTLTGTGDNEFTGSSGPNPGAQVVNGTLLLDGSAGSQTNHTKNDFYVGNTTATGASLILSNTTLNVDGWIAVGRINGGINNTSTLTLYNSTLTVGHLSFGWDGGQAGNLSSQFLTVNGNSTLNDNAEVNLCEGTGSTLTANFNDHAVFNTVNNVYIATATSSTATINFNGNSVFNIKNPTYIANGTTSTGAVVCADSSQLIQTSGWFDIAQGNNSVGTFIVKGNASVSLDSDLNVTDTGTGSTATAIIQDNATLTANNLWVGKQTGVTATLTITNNATVNSHNGLTMATYYDGTARVPASAVVNLSGGSLAVNLVQGSVTSGTNNGIFNFNGGTLIAQNPIAANFMFNLQAINVLGGGATIDSGTNNISIAQALLAGDANGGGLTKLGGGALYLNGVNTYTGATLVNEGALGGAGTIAGPVTVASGATLTAGTSTTNIGALTINSNLTLSAGSTAFLKLTPSAGNDQIAGLTGVTYGGALVVTNTSATSLTVGSVFKLFNSATAGSGNFTSVTILPSGSGTFDPTTGELTITSAGGGLTFNPITVSGGNLIITGSGGAAGGGYTLLTTTNLTTPMADWTTNVAGTFDDNGGFSNAIPVSASEPARFFRVRTP